MMVNCRTFDERKKNNGCAVVEVEMATGEAGAFGRMGLREDKRLMHWIGFMFPLTQRNYACLINGPLMIK